MDALRARALYAAASFYARARADYDLEGCNIYAEAADRLAPGVLQLHTGPDETSTTVVRSSRRPSTLEGLGLPTVQVKL